VRYDDNLPGTIYTLSCPDLLFSLYPSHAALNLANTTLILGLQRSCITPVKYKESVYHKNESCKGRDDKEHQQNFQANGPEMGETSVSKMVLLLRSGHFHLPIFHFLRRSYGSV
jgi:hypothetical protein